MTDALHYQIALILDRIRADEKSATTEDYITIRAEYAQAVRTALLELGGLVIDNAPAILAALDAAEQLAEARAHIEALTSDERWIDTEYHECAYCRSRVEADGWYGGEFVFHSCDHAPDCPVKAAQGWLARMGDIDG